VIEKANLMSILDLGPREVAILLPLGLLVVYYGVHPQPVIDASAASIDSLLKGFEHAVTATKTAGL
jgi:NADH-quinone oxidoreductase subunit M